MQPTISICCTGGCARCLKTFGGVLHLDDHLTVCDSDGFIIAGNNDLICDPCAEVEGMPGHEIVTPETLSDPAKADRLFEALAKGLHGLR